MHFKTDILVIYLEQLNKLWVYKITQIELLYGIVLYYKQWKFTFSTKASGQCFIPVSFEKDC